MTLAARNLTVGHGARAVVSDVNLAIDRGEVLCLLGPNGCGKTTLFRTLLGLLPPLAGSVTFDGRDIGAIPRAEFARDVAYVPQAQMAAFPFTVRDMVIMGRAARLNLMAAPSRKDMDVVDMALAALDIDHLADRVFTEISGGERQMALIARALAQEASILVMDEPTASLDFGNQVRVLTQVKRLARAGRSVVLSTHDPDHAFISADRVAMIHDGRVAALGAPDAIITAERLKTVYGVDVVVAVLPDTGRRVCAPSLGAVA